jgi:hypothetical protein
MFDGPHLSLSYKVSHRLEDNTDHKVKIRKWQCLTFCWITIVTRGYRNFSNSYTLWFLKLWLWLQYLHHMGRLRYKFIISKAKCSLFFNYRKYWQQTYMYIKIFKKKDLKTVFTYLTKIVDTGSKTSCTRE